MGTEFDVSHTAICECDDDSDSDTASDTDSDTRGMDIPQPPEGEQECTKLTFINALPGAEPLDRDYLKLHFIGTAASAGQETGLWEQLVSTKLDDRLRARRLRSIDTSYENCERWQRNNEDLMNVWHMYGPSWLKCRLGSTRFFSDLPQLPLSQHAAAAIVVISKAHLAAAATYPRRLLGGCIAFAADQSFYPPLLAASRTGRPLVLATDPSCRPYAVALDNPEVDLLSKQDYNSPTHGSDRGGWRGRSCEVAVVRCTCRNLIFHNSRPKKKKNKRKRSRRKSMAMKTSSAATREARQKAATAGTAEQQAASNRHSS